jgi:hypothetical protein
MSTVAIDMHRILLDSGPPIKIFDLLNQMTAIFNTSQDFSDFVAADYTHLTVMSRVLCWFFDRRNCTKGTH